MKLSKLVLLAITPFILFVGCGSDDGSSGPSTLSSLPKATSEVSGSSIQFFSVSDYLRDGFLQAATTGYKLKDWVTSWSGKSGPMCQMGNGFRNIFGEAARADKILCYMGKMEEFGLFSNSDDGTDKYYQITFAGEAGDPMKVKFNITKSGGAISSFQMWSCEGGSASNTEYVSESFTGGNASVVSAATYSDSGNTGAQRTVVSGTVNGTGGWTSKSITSNMQNSDGSFNMSAQMTIAQTASTVTVSGFQTGTFSGNTETGQIYGISQILESDSLQTLAVGDGTMKAYFRQNGSPYAAEGVAAWVGDTRGVHSSPSSADYYSTVNAATLPSVGSVSTSFQTGETWDCTASGSFATATVSESQMTDLMTCDTTFGYGEGGGGWADCSAGSY